MDAFIDRLDPDMCVVTAAADGDRAGRLDRADGADLHRHRLLDDFPDGDRNRSPAAAAAATSSTAAGRRSRSFGAPGTGYGRKG